MATATLVRRTLVGVVAGAAATAAIAGVRLAADNSASAEPVPAGAIVLQVEQFCRSRYPTLLAAFPDRPSADGWVCQYFEGDDLQTQNLRQSDMDQACRWQVGDGSRALAADRRDPHSWKCTDPSLTPNS